MIFSFQRIKRVSFFICLFLLFVFMLSQLLQLFSYFFPIRSPYQEPFGNAVKVSTMESQQNFIRDSTWLDRLLVFYWIGE
ncbi:DUF4227 family protein [Shimazuella kribbensis]|uniref:DUF4227 family protein n=1 Tax=Shimazuella kribbensis TaxID=139808 RepID=UPI0012EBA42F|nr:DUF4227 family protein [Shimazuella kribbensis]